MSASERLLFIVEGHADVRAALRLLMVYTGWDVRTFSCSAECVPAALHQIPNCILSDLSRPAMNAVEIQGALRIRGVAVPMVALTDYCDLQLNRAAAVVGINEVLDKPCDVRKLEVALKRAMTNHETTTEPMYGHH